MKNYIFIIILVFASAISLADANSDRADLVERLANNGSAEHQYLMGLKLEKINIQESKRWYEEASKPNLLKFGSPYPNGHSVAQLRLAKNKI